MVTVRGSVAALLAAQLTLAGCSAQQIARFESNVGAMRCTKFGGLAEGTPEHQQCVAAYAAAAEQERASTRAAMLDVVGASTQVWAAEQQGRANAANNALRAQQREQSATVRKNIPQAHNLISFQSNYSLNTMTCQYANGTELVIDSYKQCPSSITGGF